MHSRLSDKEMKESCYFKQHWIYYNNIYVQYITINDNLLIEYMWNSKTRVNVLVAPPHSENELCYAVDLAYIKQNIIFSFDFLHVLFTS